MVLRSAGFFRIFAFLILFFAVIASCGNPADDKSKLIVKKWAYSEFKIDNEAMPGEMFENSLMEFSADGKYKFELGPMTDAGQWKIVGDELETTSEGQEPQRMKIIELTETKLVLHTKEEGKDAYLTLQTAPAGN